METTVQPNARQVTTSMYSGNKRKFYYPQTYGNSTLGYIAPYKRVRSGMYSLLTGRWRARRRGGRRRYNFKPSASRGFFKTSAFEKKYHDVQFDGAGVQYRYPDTDAHKNSSGYDSIDEYGTVTIESDGSRKRWAEYGIYLHTISSGTGASSRIGEKIVITSINAKLHFAPNFDGNYIDFTNSNPTTFITKFNYVMRAMLIIDTQNNGRGGIAAQSPPLNGIDPNQLFEFPAQTAYSPLKMANRGRFKVLMDKIFHIDDDSGQRVTLNFFKKVRIPIIYNDITGTQNECLRNAVFLCLYNDGSNNGTSQDARARQPSFIGNIRVRYLDA